LVIRKDYFYQMKLKIFALSLFVFCACNNRKVTQVHVTNNNAFPISFIIKANNSTQTFTGIKPHTDLTGEFDWTNIQKEDGQWFLFVENENTHGRDSFAHGYFTKGELSNYLDAISEGSQLKVKVSE